VLQVGKGKVVKVTGVANPGRTATVLLRGSNKLVLEEADRSLHDALCVIRCLVNKRFLIAGGSAPEVEITQQLSKWAKTLQVGGSRQSLVISSCFVSIQSRGCCMVGARFACISRCTIRGGIMCRGRHMHWTTRHVHCNIQDAQHAPACVQGMESYCVRSYAEALEVVPYTLAENAGLNPIQIVTELRKLHASGNTYHGINVKKVCLGSGGWVQGQSRVTGWVTAGQGASRPLGWGCSCD
jgi:hypothetical protein